MILGGSGAWTDSRALVTVLRMGWRSQPRYDESRNQWFLRFKNKRYYLCSGKANHIKAYAKAAQIMGDDANPKEKLTTVVKIALGWLRLHPVNRQWVSPLLRFGAEHAPEDVHADYLVEYLAWLRKTGFVRLGKSGHYSNSSLRRYLRFARSVLTWAVSRGHFKGPVPELPKLPPAKLVDRSIAPVDVGKALSKMAPRTQRILKFIALTGCRPSEAYELKWSEVKGDRCELHRGKTFERTGEPRIVPLNQQAIDLLGKRKSGLVFVNRVGKPFTAGGLRSVLRRRGVSGPYVLRHSFAQYAVDSGLSLDDVASALGHVGGSSQTKVYARVRAMRAIRAVQSLPPIVPVDSLPKSDASKKKASKQKRRKPAQRNQRTPAKSVRAAV